MSRKYILGNPCKYCLSRPVCQKTCDDFENYGCTVHDFTFFSYLFGILVLFILSMMLIHMITTWHVTVILSMIVTFFGYVKTFIEVKKDENSTDWKEMKKWQRWLLCGFGPLLMIGSWTWDKMPVDKPLDNFIYKYIRKLQPDREY